jgi:DNA mismatch repair ATPase MutS
LAGFPNDVIVDANALLGKLQKTGVNQSNIVLKEDDFQMKILHRIKDEIGNLNLDTITPLEALNILHKLKSYN